MMKPIFAMLAFSILAAPVARADEPEIPPRKQTASKTNIKISTAATTAGRPRIGESGATNDAAGPVRIKDIADVQGLRGNQLIGYGLVVGLEGTGDGQSSQFTIQSVANMLRRFGVTVSPDLVKVKNVAAVIVTADLPPFARLGSRIDVTVNSLGDAKSLQGGTLIQTPLRAANGEVYAAAQGPLSIGGFNFEAGGSKVQKNHVNVGVIPHGAYVEQEVEMALSHDSTIQITLREPDFTTASRVAAGIRRQMPGIAAKAQDSATIIIGLPPDQADDLIGFIARIEAVGVTPDSQAKIVVNERTGTVVMGGNVRLAPGAIAHGSISIKVDNTPVIVPAPSFSKNTQPLVVPLKEATVTEKTAQLAAIPATTSVDQMVHALNMLGVTPRDLIAILEAMHRAGMITADIEVQ